MKDMVNNRRIEHEKVSGNKKRAAMRNKIFAFLFIAIICVSFLPASVWACGDTPNTDSGGSRGTVTEDTAEPIAASTGEYYFSKTLISLGGLIPLDFTLEYSPHMDLLYYHGEYPLPPILPESASVFASNTWIPLAEFTDTSTTPETEYVNIQFIHDALIFKKNSSTGQWESQMGVKYELKETEDYYYMMNPTNELVYVCDKRHKVNWNEDPYIMKIFGRVLYVMDRNGNNLTYSYNSDDQPTRIEDGLGRALTLSYTAPTGYNTYFLTEVKDSFNRTITLAYDEKEPSGWWYKHILKDITDPMGNTTQFEYQKDSNWADSYLYMTNQTLPMGNIPYEQTWENKALNAEARFRVVSQRDAYGNQTNLSYNESSGMVTVTNPDGTERVFGHESGRWFKNRTDETGKSFTMDYDAFHRPTQVTDRFGDNTFISYHPQSGKRASITNAKGDVLSYTYTAQNQTFTNPDNGETGDFTFYNLNRIDYPDGTKDEFAYDAKGNMLTRVDRAGKTWTYTYNSKGQVLTITNPKGAGAKKGGVTNYTYNADGTLASSTDSDTGTTTYGYDSYKRLNRTNYPDGTFTRIAYNLNDQITAITDERSNIYSYDYDTNGNFIKITDPAGSETQYGYDLMDRVVQITDRLGKTTNFAYDNMEQLASITDSNGITTTYGYDLRGWRNSITQGGQTWQRGYDDEGVVSSRTTPLGYTTTYQTDKLGYITGITNPLTQTATFTRDAMSRITKITDPLSRETTYGYDSRGLLTSVTKPVIGTATYTRNDLGLLSQITDLNGNNWNFGYTNMGWLQFLTDPLGNTWQHTYDSRGRRDQTTYPDASTLAMTYDNAGNIVRRLYSDGTDLQFTYDELNRLLTANDLSLTRDAEGRVTATENPGTHFDATYDDGGRLKTVTYNNGAFTVTYTYDASTGLLSSVTDDLTGARIVFTYDNDRRITDITRSNGVNIALTWDDASRLTRTQDGGIIDIKYTLDAAGQVTQADMTVPLDPADLLTAATDTFTYDAASQVSTAGYSYDQRGRLTASPGHTYSWDGASRLTGIDGVMLAYNGMSDIVTRTEGGTITHYYYNYAIGLKPIVAEKDECMGQFLRYYVWTPGGSLLYMIDAANANKVYFYHFDRTGSTIALTDATGSVTDSYAYAPYGKLLQHNGASEQPFTFVGRWGVRQEGNSGDFYHMRARYYDTVPARFISREPIWPQTSDLRKVNPYQYAINEPIGWADVTGTDVTGICNPYQEPLWTYHAGYREPISPEPEREYGNAHASTHTGNRDTQLTSWEKLDRAKEDVEDAWEAFEEAQEAAQGLGLAAYFYYLNMVMMVNEALDAGQDVSVSERDMENAHKLLDLMDAHEALQAAQQAFGSAYEQYWGVNRCR